MVRRQAKRAAAKAASVISRNHAAKARKPSPLKAAVILPTTKANQTSIAKMQTVKQSPQADRIVQEATVRMAVVEIAEAVGAEDIAEVVAVVGPEAIADLVVAEEIEAETAKISN